MAVTAIDPAAETSNVVKRDLQRLRDTTARVVGSVFYGTMLKTMRQSVIQGKYGHGGRGEEVFAAQLDALLAERMGTATRRGLGDTLYRCLERQQKGMSESRLPRGERTMG